MSRVIPVPTPVPAPVNSVNCYYVKDSVPTLIDCGVGTDAAYEVVCSTIRSAGDSPNDLKRILLTHGHGDHAGCAGRLRDETGAKVSIHKWEAPALISNPPDQFEAMRGPFEKALGRAGVDSETAQFLADAYFARVGSMFTPLSEPIELTGDETFACDDFELRFVHAPGHSPGSSCVFESESGRLFSGDCLIEEITFNPALLEAIESIAPGYRALAAYRSSLKRVRELPVSRVFPGHGPPYGGHRERIDRLLAFHDERRDAVCCALEGPELVEGATCLDIARRLFPAMEALEVYYRVFAVRVHLEALMDEGLVECVEDEKADRWYLRDTAAEGASGRDASG